MTEPAALAEAHTVTPSDQFAYTRTVEVTFERGAGPILPQPVHNARVTLIRLVYRYETGSHGWVTEIGPVHGHVIDDSGRLGTRTRALRPRDHHPSGWPAWLIDLALRHKPDTRITVQEIS